MTEASNGEILRSRIEDAFEDVWAQKGLFLFVFFVVLVATYAVLSSVGFIPVAPQPQPANAAVAAEVIQRDSPVSTATNGDTVDVHGNVVRGSTGNGGTVASDGTHLAAVSSDAAALPRRITIDSIGLDTPVLNPQSTSIADLDAQLLKGAVRHPDSADFVNTGSIVIFGHSSYLPVVHNLNFKAFNGIQKLTWGDHIEVYSSERVYTYRVEKVYKAKASEDTLQLDNSSPRLVLVTCNSFGSKDDRYVLEASLIDSKAL